MKLLFLLLFASMFFICCNSSTQNINQDKIQITVSVLPQKFFVTQIIGKNSDFNIQVMIPPGSSPATYSPTPRQLQNLSHSKIYFRIGYIPFEFAWMKNISDNNPELKIVDTSVGVNLIKPILNNNDVENHDEYPSHDHHHHNGVDPHIWLSSSAVKIQAKHILNALIELSPKQSNVFIKNYNEFLNVITQTDSKIKALFEKKSGGKFMVFHPAWSYFAREYNIVQIPIEFEGKDPNPADMKKIIDIAAHENIRSIFVQAQFDTHSAETVANEINAQVVKIDPLAENWVENMERIAQAIGSSIRNISEEANIIE